MNHPHKRIAQICSSQGQRDSWQPTGPCRFQQLPQALVMDILSRLSPNNLLSCRCVCKPWLFIISEPHFNRLCHSRSPMGVVIQTYPHCRNWRLRKLYFTQIIERAGPDLQLERMCFRPKISIPVPADRTYLSQRCGLINSCNGLLCLGPPNTHRPLHVCNPISGEFITTPPLGSERSVGCFVGLGFSAATNDYKVLCPSVRGGLYIYTIGTGVWRDIEKPPSACIDSSPFNAFVHSALHWTEWSRDGYLIHSFNFETEKFGMVPPPSGFGPKDKLSSCNLGVFEGCLLLCGYVGNTSKFEMWIMRDYGVQESWTKTFVIEGLNPRKVYDPIMFLSNGEILLSNGDGDGAVVCYNPETKSVREISIAPTESQCFATGYSPSFVSLHDIAKGEEVKRIRNNENFNKLFTEGSITATGSGTLAHQCTNLTPGSCPPGVEEAPRTPIVTNSTATSNEQLDFALRIGTKCAICAGELGYVLRGKGFAMCQKCFDAISS